MHVSKWPINSEYQWITASVEISSDSARWYSSEVVVSSSDFSCMHSASEPSALVLVTWQYIQTYIVTDSQSTENISLFHAYARKNNMWIVECSQIAMYRADLMFGSIAEGGWLGWLYLLSILLWDYKDIRHMTYYRHTVRKIINCHTDAWKYFEKNKFAVQVLCNIKITQ